MRRAFASALLLLAATALPAFAQEEEVYDNIENIHGDADGFFELFGAITDAFLFDNPMFIAENAAYPLPVQANGEAYDILEAGDLVENFDYLLTPETQDALGSEEADNLIVTSEGVGLANGAMWVTNVCLDDDCAETQWQIISINN